MQVTLANTGDHPGVEVVQLYRSESLGTETRALRTLRGFRKVWVQPGESTTVTLPLPEDAEPRELWLGPSSDPHDLACLADR